MVNLRFMRNALAGLAWFLAGLTATAEDRPALTVFAAASLGDALSSVVPDWPGEVRVSVGGSGAIARQVDQGAPADVVMLANPDWMDWLEQRGRLVPGSRLAPFGNTLVLVGPPGAPPLPSVTPEDVLERLGSDGRFAIGEHRSVPAGQYAKDWLTASGLWEPLRPRLAEVENVRAALALVSRGEVPLAIVYTSDLVADPGAATSVWTIPPEEQPDIRYELAAVTPAGAELAQWLGTPAAQDVFAEFGFVGIVD
jgi:molybdate transport system substrate-binding protein